MKTLASLFVKLFGAVASLFSVKKWGEATAKKEQAEKIVEERNEDAKIASKPFVRKPFSRMRRKK